MRDLVMDHLRILVADSHDVVRRSVRATLESEAMWTVCDEATTGLETIAKTLEQSPDVVVLDVGLPGLNGVQVTREIRRLVPGVQVLVMTMHTSEHLERHLSEAGASGYVAKAEAGRALVDAIKVSINAKVTSDPVEEDHLQTLLTTREREVMHLLAEGKSNKEIAMLLTISPKTVETHRARIMDKLRVRSMNQLVRYAIRRGIITP
jgi:DNA-binding NarL/FixJ family response regulator